MDTVRVRALSVALTICATIGLAVPATAQTAADSAAIQSTALDYVEGWYEGDGDRMERALHPELSKRIVRASAGQSELVNMTAVQLIDATRSGGGTNTPADARVNEIAILDIFGDVASVRADMSGWIDYMHMARWNGEWRIVNVLWETR